MFLPMGLRIEFQSFDAVGQPCGQFGIRGQLAAGKQPPPVRRHRPTGAPPTVARQRMIAQSGIAIRLKTAAASLPE